MVNIFYREFVMLTARTEILIFQNVQKLNSLFVKRGHSLANFSEFFCTIHSILLHVVVEGIALTIS